MSKKPIIIINFKTYETSIANNAVRLAKICEKVAIETNSDIRVAVSAADVYHVSKEVTIPVYCEHVDYFSPGRNTGAILPEIIKGEGAKGSLVNHSEHQVPMVKIKETIKRLNDNHLLSIVCADTPQKAEEIAHFDPDMIAVEPPELIGGDVSVSKAKPEIITKSVKEVKEKHKVRLLVGAGVKNNEDLRKAMELGADGVLLASGITTAKDPEKALKELII